MEQINVGDCFFDNRDNIIFFVNKVINDKDINATYLVAKATNVFTTHILTSPRHLLRFKRVNANAYLKICKLLHINATMCRNILLNSKPLASGPVSYYTGKLPYIHIHKLDEPKSRLDISNTILSTHEGVVIPISTDKYMDKETYGKIFNICSRTFISINDIIKNL